MLLLELTFEIQELFSGIGTLHNCHCAIYDSKFLIRNTTIVILTSITIWVCVLHTFIVWAGTFITTRHNETQMTAWCISLTYAYCTGVVSLVSKNCRDFHTLITDIKPLVTKWKTNSTHALHAYFFISNSMRFLYI